MTRVLVTGAGSFTARHLLPIIAEARDTTLLTTDRAGASTAPAGYAPLDLTDRAAVHAFVATAKPELVYHLAGASSADEALCFAVNLDGTRHVLEACAALGAATRVVVVSSAAVYGLTRLEDNPVNECVPLRPVTAYGASKAAAELAALAMHRRGALRVKVARTFNLVGPGLRAGFAPTDFMARAMALRGTTEVAEIMVGALEPRRDFVDVRDAARAYRLLGEAESGWGEPYNVATGTPVAIRDLFEAVVRACGVRARPVEDPARRRVEVLEQTGDSSVLRRETGWAPRIALETSLRDMATAWR